MYPPSHHVYKSVSPPRHTRMTQRRRFRLLFLTVSVLGGLWLASRLFWASAGTDALLAPFDSRVYSSWRSWEEKALVGSSSTKPEGRSSSIAKVTMLYGKYNEAYHRALQGQAAHTQKHRYPLFALEQELVDGLWSKPSYMLHILLVELQKPEEERLKWIFWFDADVIITNPNVPLEVFLPPEKGFEHINILTTVDHKGLNDGVFFMRVCNWSAKLMASVVAVQFLRPEVKLKYAEQSAMEHLIDNEQIFHAPTLIVPQRWFNAYMGPRFTNGTVFPNRRIKGNSVKDGDVLVHFAGHGETKQERMLALLNALDDPVEREKWEVPFEETGLRKEVRDFWAEQRRIMGDDPIEIVEENGPVSEDEKVAVDWAAKKAQMEKERKEKEKKQAEEEAKKTPKEEEEVEEVVVEE
ncbi:MAG: Xanthine phosphoribosyltransferase 1 [Chaenotheca gracillima]|nr:MAG: Xanthine phosphoribosyltransferase 1 [Chaenotheca gracillima]